MIFLRNETGELKYNIQTISKIKSDLPAGTTTIRMAARAAATRPHPGRVLLLFRARMAETKNAKTELCGGGLNGTQTAPDDGDLCRRTATAVSRRRRCGPAVAVARRSWHSVKYYFRKIGDFFFLDRFRGGHESPAACRPAVIDNDRLLSETRENAEK